MKTLALAILLAISAPLHSQPSFPDTLPFQSPWLISVKLAAHIPVPQVSWLESVNMSANPSNSALPIPDLSLDRATEELIKTSASLSKNN